MSEPVKGYKVFNPDWTCRDKQYTCPGVFEEDVDLEVCVNGMHFCKEVADCFRYYDFSPHNHVAEVIAYGKVVEGQDKCCTDKLKIVRELTWHEMLDIANSGVGCTGLKNIGDYNSGDHNDGYRNCGSVNHGNHNTGSHNIGNWNCGIFNKGNHNSGGKNNGNYNTGDCNSGSRNCGDFNRGDSNSGRYNIGECNDGYYNSGNHNSGDSNNGSWNSGDWNKTDHSSGCFNTEEQKMYFFNKPSNMTYKEWLNSRARDILCIISLTDFVDYTVMTDEEKKSHPDAEVVGGYLRKLSNKDRQKWWNRLNKGDKKIVLSLPNFDKDIFKEITGIDVEKGR